jgi:hypothetical protein
MASVETKNSKPSSGRIVAKLFEIMGAKENILAEISPPSRFLGKGSAWTKAGGGAFFRCFESSLASFFSADVRFCRCHPFLPAW